MPPKRFPHLLKWAAVVVLSSALIFWLVLAAIPAPQPAPRWTAASGDPVPDSFLYAMFPLNNAVPLCDAPDGKPVAKLTRAVANSQREIDAGGWVQVQDANVATWVALDNLVYSPAPGDTTDYFDAFVTAHRARAPGDFRSATLELHTEPNQVTIATLRLSQDDHWQKYVYQVSPGPPKPLEMYSASGPGEALRAVPRFLMACGSSAAFFIIAVPLISLMIARSRRAHARNPRSVGE
jgi:hypothetical protein